MACPTREELEAYLRSFVVEDMKINLTRSIKATNAPESAYWTGTWDGEKWSGDRHKACLESVDISVSDKGKVEATAVFKVEVIIKGDPILGEKRRVKTIRVPLYGPQPSARLITPAPFTALPFSAASAVAAAPAVAPIAAGRAVYAASAATSALAATATDYTPLVHTFAAPRAGRAVAAVSRSGSFHPAPATFDPPAPAPAPAHCCCCCAKKTA